MAIAVEIREQVEGLAEALPARGVLGERGDAQVLLDGEGGEDALPLGDVPDAEPRDLVGRALVNGPSSEADGAALGMDQAHDRAHGRRLAGSVPAEQHRHRVRADPERDTLQNVVLADVGVDALHLEETSFCQRRPRSTPPGLPRSR